MILLKNIRISSSLGIGKRMEIKVCRFKSRATSFPAEYCMDLVRQNDHENFLCTLLLPESIRTTAFAVRAFNSEVARVNDLVSNTTIAQMRLTFWKEAVDKIFKDCPPEHPISKEIHRALKKHKLSKVYFNRLVTSRKTQSSENGFPSLEALEKYSENSVSPIFYLLLQAAGVQDVNIDHAMSHLGKAQGIANALRSVPHLARKADNVSFPLPIDLLMEHNVSSEAILRGGNESLKEVTYKVASRGKLHLDKATSLMKGISREVFLLFLPAVPVSGYLNKLQKVNFDIFHPFLTRRDSFLPVKLYWAKLRSSF